jgi:hypothetical protein
MAAFLVAALSLPTGEQEHALQATPPQQLPADLAGMMDEANPPLDPEEVFEMEHSLDLKMAPGGGGHIIDSGSHVPWIKKKKLGVCACAKCGTTALFNGIYKGVYGHDKEWKGDIQQIHAKGWKGLWDKKGAPWDFFAAGIDGNESGTHDGHAIAFVREPVSRLVSAWKDKFSCGLWVPQGKEGKGDGGWFEASDGHSRRMMNIKFLTKLVGSGGSGDVKKSNNCPCDKPESANTNSTFSCSCSYSNCLSLEKFADYLMIVHKKGLQDELNAHVRPQSRDCFQKGATPDKWDKVTTGYDTASIKKLGALLNAHIDLDDGTSMAQGVAHSTADALMDGKPLKIPGSVISKLKKITREEEQMLHKYYGHTTATLMGREFHTFVEHAKEADVDPEPDFATIGSWHPGKGLAKPKSEQY